MSRSTRRPFKRALLALRIFDTGGSMLAGMIKRVLLITVVFAFTASAQAGEAPHSAAPEGGAPASEGPVELYNARDEAADRASAIFGPDETCQRNLDSPPVVVPVTEDDRLTGYAFVVPRICLKRSGRFDHLSNIHFLTDRFLRAAHRTPFQVHADGTLDREATEAAMLAAVAEFIPAEDVDRLDLLGEDIRYVR